MDVMQDGELRRQLEWDEYVTGERRALARRLEAVREKLHAIEAELAAVQVELEGL
jgi:hypothetical protein